MKKTSSRAKKKPPAPTSRQKEVDRALFTAFKVVELTTVDDKSLESALNHWCSLGWRFDGVQFAMRESSRRPSMAFLIFAREVSEGAHDLVSSNLNSEQNARRRLAQLAEDGSDDEVQVVES